MVKGLGSARSVPRNRQSGMLTGKQPNLSHFPKRCTNHIKMCLPLFLCLTSQAPRCCELFLTTRLATALPYQYVKVCGKGKIAGLLYEHIRRTERRFEHVGYRVSGLRSTL